MRNLDKDKFKKARVRVSTNAKKLGNICNGEHNVYHILTPYPPHMRGLAHEAPLEVSDASKSAA